MEIPTNRVIVDVVIMEQARDVCFLVLRSFHQYFYWVDMGIVEMRG